MESPRVPVLVTVTAALLLVTGAGFGLAAVGNLFFGRNIWAEALSPFEALCCVALVIAAVQLRRGNRRWWILAFVLVPLARGEFAAETWVAEHRFEWWSVIWVLGLWTLLAWPTTRAHLRTMAAWEQQEAEHSEAGHFAPSEQAAESDLRDRP